jgi:hypothetical protein
MGGMAGALGGATLAVATGYILQSTGQNYTIVFFIAGSAYLIALLVIQLLAPQLRPVEDVEQIPPGVSVGGLIGFGFVGLVFGSFVGWCTGLLSRVTGQTLFEYMMIGAGIGIVIGVISGYLIRNQSKSA